MGVEYLHDNEWRYDSDGFFPNDTKDGGCIDIQITLFCSWSDDAILIINCGWDVKFNKDGSITLDRYNLENKSVMITIIDKKRVKEILGTTDKRILYDKAFDNLPDPKKYIDDWLSVEVSDIIDDLPLKFKLKIWMDYNYLLNYDD